jgi:hypothetical protein
MNVDGCTDPVFSLIFVDGLLDQQMDGWRGTDGLDVDGRINGFMQIGDGGMEMIKMHVDGWINRFMQIGDGWMGMIKCM